MANKPIDKEYLLAQFKNFAKVIGSNFVAKESGKSLISSTDLAQITTNANAIKTLQSSSAGSSSSVNEATVKQIVNEKISAVVNGANENYDTLKEIADWIIDTGSSVSGKATKFDYDPETQELTLYAGDKILNSARIETESAEDHYFIAPEFTMDFATGSLIMTGGRGATFSLDDITGHLIEGKEDE